MADSSSAEFLKRISQLSKDAEQLQAFFDSPVPGRAAEVQALMRSVSSGVASIRKLGQAMAAQVDQLAGLMQTAELLNESLEVATVLETVIDTIIRLTGAERAFVVLQEGDDLTIRVARNWDQETIAQPEATFSRSIIRAALNGNEPILTTNAQTDERFGQALSVSAKALRSVLCVPLLSRRKPIGVIYADNRVMAGVFNQDTVALVTAFAHQAAIAIDNAQQFERVRADLEQANRKLEILRVQIDEQERKRQFEEVTETDYFKRLERMARLQRSLRSEAENPSPER